MLVVGPSEEDSLGDLGVLGVPLWSLVDLSCTRRVQLE